MIEAASSTHCFNGAAHLRARRCRLLSGYISHLGRLQRGRALARAEIARFERVTDRKIVASTGPRTCARGDRLCAFAPYRRCRASTGPRTCARGDRARPLRSALQTRLQRGRALARAEIADDRTRTAKERDASTGPRTCARGDRGKFAVQRRGIQGFNGAAHLRARRFSSSPQKQSKGAPLQRGRALARAEMPSRIANAPPPGRLQRGRALARAEMPTPSRSSNVRSRFNGAAHLRARRWRSRGADRKRRFASTGPRTCARGDDASVSGIMTTDPLQRGRALARAEITRVRSMRRGTSCFNGAAHLRARR